MEFRKSTKNDVPKIMNIVKQAQNYFKEQGIDQWQNNYPNDEVINNDINNIWERENEYSIHRRLPSERGLQNSKALQGVFKRIYAFKRSKCNKTRDF